MKPGSLYDRIFGFLGQLIALNLLWIVCSLPVITAGASTTALYYCTLKLHKDGDIRVFHDFFKSFKQNFKQSTLIWILMAAVAVFLYMEKESLVTMPGSMPQIFNYVILAVCIPLIAIALYIFPTVAAFENKTMTLITNAFYFAVKHIGYALAVAVITILQMTMTLVDAICLKKVKRVAIPEEEQNKIKDTFGKGQPRQEEKNENEQAGPYTVDGLTYRYSYIQSEQVSDVEELGFQIAKFSFDDCGDMTLASSEKKEREERFQNYIKAGSGKVSEKEAKEKVSGLGSGDWEIFESSSKALTEGSTTLEKDDFIFERMIDGVPVNYVRETSLPVNEQALEWENEDGTLHEGQSEGWENEVLTMDFCSGTLQSFLHRNPIEASNASDERLFLLPFDEVKDIFEKTITLQVMTEDRNRMISVDGGSHYRYPSIDAQSAEITITKVQLGYMCMPDSEGSDTEAVLIPVWDFYGTWTSKEPEYEYGNGEDGPVIGDVTMDAAGVPLLTIDARDGSVIQRIQAGWAASMGSKDIK